MVAKGFYSQLSFKTVFFCIFHSLFNHEDFLCCSLIKINFTIITAFFTISTLFPIPENPPENLITFVQFSSCPGGYSYRTQAYKLRFFIFYLEESLPRSSVYNLVSFNFFIETCVLTSTFKSVFISIKLLGFPFDSNIFLCDLPFLNDSIVLNF